MDNIEWLSWAVFSLWNNIDDFMLVPGIMEKMCQLQVKYNTDPTITHAKGDILTI